MKLVRPDFDRRIEIEGVPAPVRRPVDIDQEKTGFANLRTLRIYRFEPGSVIDGHAEEDEVFIILLAGSAELLIKAEGSDDISVLLSAGADPNNSGCAAYLPPHAVYKLVPREETDVAYARATPVGSIPPKIFFRRVPAPRDGVTVLLDEMDYAERLRLRLLQIDAAQQGTRFRQPESTHEALFHVRNIKPAGNATLIDSEGTRIELESWDTVALVAGERPELQLAARSSVLVLIVLAS